MSKSGPIILIEDDEDDIEIFISILKDLNICNKLNYFITSTEAYDYLITTLDKPFLIICDVNMPGESGIEFKKRIDENEYLRSKSIPFIFYSTSADKLTVQKAYSEMTVQGFFQKSASYSEINKVFNLIFEYWKVCKHPNSE